MYIPFRQGDVFRPTQKTKIALEQCFNPFGTGQCLTTEELRQLAEKANSLNPFGTGQCLTTENGELRLISLPFVSIPLEQGSVLRLAGKLPAGVDRVTSQSLWNRAVSYDCSGVIKPCATRLTEATSQLFPRLRELGLDLAKF